MTPPEAASVEANLERVRGEMKLSAPADQVATTAFNWSYGGSGLGTNTAMPDHTGTGLLVAGGGREGPLP